MRGFRVLIIGLAWQRPTTGRPTSVTAVTCPVFPRDMYKLVRTTHEEGRKLLGKRTTQRSAWQEWNTFIRPLAVPFDTMLMWMMQTGRYMPTSDWAVGSGGRGFYGRKANAMWWMSRWPEHTSIENIRDLFFEAPDRFTHASAPQQDFPATAAFGAPPSGDVGDCFSTEMCGAMCQEFIPLEQVTGKKLWCEHTYEEAKQMAVEVRAFRPTNTPPVEPFPEPKDGRPSERSDHDF